MSERIAGDLTQSSYSTAVAIAEIPEQIRGYGHVKQKAMAEAKAIRKKLLAEFTQGRGTEKAA